MGLAIHPSGSSESSVSWLELPPASSSSPPPTGSPPAAGMLCGGAGGHLWLRCKGRRPLRLHLLLRRGGRVVLLLLLLLASVLLLLMQATMQSLQVTGLTWHHATRSARREGKKGITDLRAVHLIRAIYRRHRKHRSKNRTIRPESNRKKSETKLLR